MAVFRFASEIYDILHTTPTHALQCTPSLKYKTFSHFSPLRLTLIFPSDKQTSVQYLPLPSDSSKILHITPLQPCRISNIYFYTTKATHTHAYMHTHTCTQSTACRSAWHASFRFACNKQIWYPLGNFIPSSHGNRKFYYHSCTFPAPFGFRRHWYGISVLQRRHCGYTRSQAARVNSCTSGCCGYHFGASLLCVCFVFFFF